MNNRNIERIVLYVVIGVLSVALIGAAAVAIITNLNKAPDNGGGSEPIDNTEATVGDETDDAPDETEPETGDVTGSETTSEPETTVPDTTRPAVTEPNFNVNAYDAPKTMYALFNVNVRASATTDSIILFMIYQSEAVTVKGETDNGWYVIEARGSTGYVRCDLLTDDPTAAEVHITEYTEPKTMYAKSDVNVRESYSTNSKVITTVEVGTEVTVTGETDNGWYQVLYDGATAYIKSEYLAVTKPTVPSGSESTAPSTGTGSVTAPAETGGRES